MKLSVRTSLRLLVMAIGLSSVMVTSAALLFQDKPALALAPPHVCPDGTYADFGRNENYGYFRDICWGSWGDNVVQSGVPATIDTAAELVTWVNALLNSASAQNRSAGQFLVLTMLPAKAGYPYPDYVRADALARFDDWKAAVTLADVENRIQWHYSYPFPCGTKNTRFQSDDGGATGIVDDDFYFQASGDASAPCGAGVTVDSIRFMNSAGTTQYAIKRFCANPIGVINALTVPNYAVTLAADRNGNPATVTAGQTGLSIGIDVRNTGPTASDPGILRIEDPTNINTVTGAGLSGTSCRDAAGAAVACSTPFAWNGTATTCGQSGRNWDYNTRYMLQDVTHSGTVSFNINAGVAVGTVITFNIYYCPADENGAVRPVTVSFTVASVKLPSVQGFRGDIHAGGGVGVTCTGAGTVTGRASAGSKGEYVVAASGSGISNFGADAFLGQTGGKGDYASVCRADLYKAATDYFGSSGTGYVIRGSGVVIDPSDPAYSVGVVHVTGNATVSGAVTQKLTIVADGNVTIADDITNNSSTPDPHAAASLGIIANGNISISYAALRVDAYLFSNQVIDTCYQQTFNLTTCNNVLTMHGFLMGNSIYFRRQGDPRTSGSGAATAVPAEQIFLTPQIYLNPPRFFDATVDDILLEGQGEKQPLY
jgi:hypothetical protein